MRKPRSTHARRPASRKTQLPRTDNSSIAESGPNVPAPASIADAARQRMIAEADYYRAERRGFEPGRELNDWLNLAQKRKQVPSNAAGKSPKIYYITQTGKCRAILVRRLAARDISAKSADKKVSMLC